MKIAGTVALVTGGSRGIGKACVEKLLSLGAKVCFTGVSEENGDETLQEMKTKYGEGKVLFCQCDVTDYQGMESVFMSTEGTFGKLDIIINNAGIMDAIEWKKTLNINVIGSYGVIVLAMKYLGTSNGKQGGVVINMGSALGVVPAFFSPAYSASKHALVGMTRSYGSPEHFAENGVRVNAFCPWLVQTGMTVVGGNQPLLPEKAKETFDLLKRLKRITPQTVAEETVRLIEDESKNGEIVLLDHDQETKVVTFQEFFPTSNRQK